MPEAALEAEEEAGPMESPTMETQLHYRDFASRKFTAVPNSATTWGSKHSNMNLWETFQFQISTAIKERKEYTWGSKRLDWGPCLFSISWWPCDQRVSLDKLCLYYLSQITFQKV